MFCANCGTQITDAFCPGCGKPAPRAPLSQSPAAPVASAPAAPAIVAAPKKGSPVAKFLLIGCGLLALLGILATAGMYYAASRLKAKAFQKISEATGVSLPGGGVKSRSVFKNPCALLPKEDLEQVLDVRIDKSAEITETGEQGCAFFASSEAFQKLARDSAAQVRKEAEAKAAKPDKAGPTSDNPLALLNNDNIRSLEGVVKTLGTAGQATEGPGRVFAFTVSNIGRDSWQVGRTALGIIPGFEELSGVGDKAMVGPFGSLLYVLKGDTQVTLQLTTVPDARVKGVDLARRIVSRL